MFGGFFAFLWTVAAGAQGLSVSTSLAALTIHPGDANVAIPVSVGPWSGYSGGVTVTLTGLPSGMTVTPANVLPGTSGTVLLSASVSADQEAFPPAVLVPDLETATSTVQVTAVAGTAQATTPLALTVSLGNPAFVPSTINLPVVRINTAGAPITSTAVDVPGTITVTSADGTTSYLPNASDTDTTATFHVHGHSTSMMPKLPYDIKLTTSLDLLNVMGLSCPYVTNGSAKPTCDKSKSYLLLANYDDKTMLRDWAASALANAIPYGGSYLSPSALPAGSTGQIPTPSGTKALLPWAPHSLFVEVFLNGVYEGTYQLIEQIKVDSHRVNITELAQTQVSGDLSGGYLLEFDQHQDENYVFLTPPGLPVGVVDPNYAPEVPEQMAYITGYVNTAANALFSSAYQDPIAGWRAYFDQAAAVNFYLVNEVMGNVDGGAFYSSDFLYKAADNPYLYFGPVWDFDISSGNVNYQPVVDPTVPWAATQNPYYPRLFSDPSFKAATQQQWNALKSNGVLSAWTASIQAEAAMLQQTQQNNFGRWPMQGIEVWPNSEAAGSYAGELNYLLNWINVRMGFIDSFLNGTPATSTAVAASQGTVAAGAPVTLTAKVTGSSPTGTVTFTYNSLVLAQAPLNGQGVASLTTSSIPPGNWEVGAVYAGDAHNALSAAPAASLTVQPVLLQTSANLSASAAGTSYATPLTFTAVVVGTSGSGTPTGTVTFSADGAAIGSAPLNGAGAATVTSNLAGGSIGVQARYSGDGVYAASVSNLDTVVVTTDFQLSTSQALSETLPANGTVSFPLTLTPLGGSYPGTVNLSVSGTPPDVNCALSTSSIAPTAGPQAVTLTCGYSAQHAAVRRKGDTDARPLLCGVLVLLLPLATVRKSRRALLLTMLVLGVSALLTGVTGCGSGSGAPGLVTYDVTVTGNAGFVQHTVQVSLRA